MEKLERYNLVKVIASNDINTDSFVGSIGIVTKIHNHEYPYEILFASKNWKKYQLEAI